MENKISLKKLLRDLSKDGSYYAEIVDYIGEIYLMGETTMPIAIIEIKKDICHLNIRRDIPPNIAAQLSCDLSRLCHNIIIGSDFMITVDKGYIYGDEASSLYYVSIHDIIQHNQIKQEAGLSDAFFVVQEPIYGYNKSNNSINNNRKLWRDE